MRAIGVVLAAGAGNRLGTPKAQLRLDDVRLVDRAIVVLRDGGCDDVLAVVRSATEVDGARAVVNPEPDRGLSSSLRLGLTAAAQDVGADLAVLLLVDLPGIGAAAVRRVLDAASAGGAPIIVATYAGRRGHPVAIRRRHWDEVARLAQGDEGARQFLRTYPELVVDVPCEGDPADIDTPAQLAHWLVRDDQRRSGMPGR